MKVTKNVILDLMPLYLADEVSPDTKTLVDNYLETDPELAKTIKDSSFDSINEINLPFKKEDKLEAYIKVKQMQMIKTIVIAVITSGVFLAILAAIMLFSKKLKRVIYFCYVTGHFGATIYQNFVYT